MEITLKQLLIENFKGIQSLEVDLDHRTNISGANATGKSTIQDAFTWLLFGKNSDDKKDFNIKNTVRPELNKHDHSVTGVLDVDGRTMKLQRIYREKWTKRRGSEESELTGHESSFLINDTPCNMSEYNETVNQLLEENTFKLLTNIYHFNTTLPWQQRRSMLLSLVGGIDDDKVAEGTQLQWIVDKMREDQTTLEKLRKRYYSERTAAAKELERLPARISEVQGMMENIPDVDVDETNTLQERYGELSDVLNSAQKEYEQHREAIAGHKRTLSEIEAKIQLREMEIRKVFGAKYDEISETIRKKRIEFQDTLSQKSVLEAKIKEMDSMAEEYKRRIEELREDWFKIDQERLDPAAIVCPSCNQNLPEDKRESILTDFNSTKAKRLAKINESGTKAKSFLEKDYPYQVGIYQDTLRDVSKAQLRLNKEITELTALKDGLPDIKTVFAEDEELSNLTQQIKSLQDKVMMVGDSKQVSETKNECDKILRRLEEINNNAKRHNELNERMEQLLQQEKDLAIKIAQIEGLEYELEVFTARKMEMLEGKVNELFNAGVKFSLFKNQLNGGVDETCETLIEGVPFADANHAGQINAGISIINVFGKNLDIQAPIWIDNAEACLEVTDTPAQLIRLVVADCELTIETII